MHGFATKFNANTVESRFKKDFGSEQNLSKIEILSYFKQGKITKYLYK